MTEGVAPQQRLYYCERCKVYVLPMDAEVKMQLVASFEKGTVTEVAFARHKKCGKLLKEKFWHE
ncbi:MAG: hypothetical protein ABSC91_06010 [Candidatus Bathyarchaeia archaeon]|jgi:hypothetical protein